MCVQNLRASRKMIRVLNYIRMTTLEPDWSMMSMLIILENY